MKKSLIIILLLVCQSLLAQESTTAAETPVVEPALPAADPAQAQEDLLLAYKKEYAFLTSQVNNIQNRLAEFKIKAALEKRQVESQISALENQLLNAEATASQLEEEIYTIQRNAESVEDNQGLMASTIIQAQSTMTEYGFDGFAAAEDTEVSDLSKVETLVALANQTVSAQASITSQPGEFFLTDGTQVSGEVLKVGNIASYGHSPQGSGVLAPAGEKQFKVWQDSDPDAAAGIVQGQANGLLPIFLYESSIKAIEEKEQKTIISVINSGGLIAWIIAGLGAFALLLIILRVFFLHRASASTEKLLGGVVSQIEQRDVEGAIKQAQKESSSSSRVLLSALRNIDRDRDHIEDIVSESILHESSQLNRFGSLILVIATVAPLLGLLGTVTGMIATFDIITDFGTGDPKLLSGGISVALVTTEVGLAVAIPTLLFGNILSGWAERIKDDMEKAALRAINVYKKTFA
ncbi:MotA/TolQ/ExbB proton channel family protein [Marinicella meishanensis]|uniref:MotA/TolQ/ExbB proton channel family protein n=1 Tax=Marinicella meishanensis TaxID=2873263 RepID=UPI001CBD85D6|nr:MotA/TolQ/ExbB proton channel family protein [Marinicella sp. NBU2979]